MSKFLSVNRQHWLAVLSLLVLLGLWQGLALHLHAHTFPAPFKVASVLWQAILSGELPYHLGVTLLRLLISFSIAMLLGSMIGIALGRNQNLDAFF
jgi:NitT/TauT family transport system permease protein